MFYTLISHFASATFSAPCLPPYTKFIRKNDYCATCRHNRRPVVINVFISSAVRGDCCLGCRRQPPHRSVSRHSTVIPCGHAARCYL